MKMKSIKLIICSIILGSLSLLYANKKNSEENNYVPDKETAIKIAEAIWLPIYGKKIYSEKPFEATLDKKAKIWIVHGTLSANAVGGVAYIEIQKSDCKILNVYHEK